MYDAYSRMELLLGPSGVDRLGRAQIASLLNIKFKKAFPAVILGIFMATIIMCVITYFIPWLVTNVF